MRGGGGTPFSPRIAAVPWQTEKEHYRLATHADLPALVDMLGDPEVGRWLWFTPMPPEAVEEYFSPLLTEQTRVASAGQSPTTAVFAVESPDGEFLGQGAAVAIDSSPLGFEIGFQLCRRAWGRGVGTRLGRFVSAYAIYRCGAYRLEASCLEGNTGSRRILEGLGLKLEGVRPGYRLKEGVRHTELIFGAETSTLDLTEIDELAKAVGVL